jgi:RNA polymerase sigma-70 factor (ECF subfamily)
MNKDEVFKNILEENQSAIRAYVAGFGINLAHVDDIAQDVFIEYYKNMDKKPAHIEDIRWLKGIAKNLTFNHIRQQKRKIAKEFALNCEILATTETPLEKVLENNELAHALANCMTKVSQQSRDLLALRYSQGLNSNKIAHRLGKTAEAVRIALKRVRDFLKKCLQNEQFEGVG